MAAASKLSTLNLFSTHRGYQPVSVSSRLWRLAAASAAGSALAAAAAGVSIINVVAMLLAGGSSFGSLARIRRKANVCCIGGVSFITAAGNGIMWRSLAAKKMAAQQQWRNAATAMPVCGYCNN